MKSLSLFLMGTLFLAGATNPALKDVHTVYVLPMSSNLDQFLAVRLTAGSVFQVVTDPQKADAVFTERIGANFEEALQNLNGNEEKKPEKQGDSTYVRPTMKPLSSGKGSIFLVDRKSHNVIWSLYEKPKGKTTDDISHMAGKIVDRLEKDLKGK